MSAPALTLLSTDDLIGLESDQLSEDQVEELGWVANLLAALATTYPARIGRVLTVLQDAMVSLLEGRQRALLPPAIGEELADTGSVHGELLDYGLPVPNWPFPGLHLVTKDVTPRVTMPDQDAPVAANPDAKLFKGRFRSGYTSRAPRVRFVRLEDASHAYDLGPGYRESRVAFSQFVCYRDFGPERSLRRVAELMQAPVETIAARSRVWRWVDRVRLWDAEQHRLYGTPTTREEDAMAPQDGAIRPRPAPVDQVGRQRMAWLRRNEARMRAILGVEDDELWALVTKDWGLDGKTS